MGAHAAVAAELLGSRDLVAAVLADFRSSPLADKEKALLALIATMNADPKSVNQADVDRAKAAGWTDEALYDAMTVCALFRFYNSWVDAAGVREMPASAYEAMGIRLSASGYAPFDSPTDSA